MRPFPAMKIELSGHYGYRRIVKTLAPMVATMIVISTYSVVDGLIVSNFVGNTAFAAMNLIWPVLLGIDGIWLSVSVAEVFACIMSAILILSFRKRYGY